MQYEDLEEDKLPREVWDKMFALIQMEPDALIEEMLTWNAFYGRWAVVCRERPQSERLKYINNGTFLELATKYQEVGDEVPGTLMTTLWCMPDVFLDNVITIHKMIMSMPSE